MRGEEKTAFTKNLQAKDSCIDSQKAPKILDIGVNYPNLRVFKKGGNCIILWKCRGDVKLH